MAYSVTLFNFSKRSNSTKRPDMTTGTSFACSLRDGSGILNPTIRLQIPKAQVLGFNYAYINDFNRFYRITDSRWQLGLWELDLTVDALASWRPEILATSTYVFRADTGIAGSGFVDNMYPFMASVEKVNSVYVDPPGPTSSHFTAALSQGSYVLGVLSKGTTGAGGVKYYAMGYQAFATMCNNLFDDASWLDIDDISVNLQKALINPIQYVTSCRWYPFRTAAFTGTTYTSLYLGWWQVNVPCKEIDSDAMTIHKSLSIAIPKHPAYITYGQEMLLAPATRYTAVIPPWGQFQIDPLEVVNATDLIISYDVDIATGQAIAYFGTEEYDGDTTRQIWFDTRLGELGITIPVAQVTQNFAGLAQSIVSTSGSILTGNVLGAVGGVISGVESQMPKVTYTGEIGNLSTLAKDPMIMAEFLMPAERNRAEFGTPVFASATLGSFSGYVQCHADFQAPCLQAELEEIRQHMEAGFYVE